MEELLSRARTEKRAGARIRRGEGRRWRARAWQLVREGRMREAADVQRALVSSRLSGGPRAALRDRFRLLRLHLVMGEWEQALADIEALYGRLARRGILGGAAAGWVFLARAVSQFHLGQGRRFRRSLATVLRGARHGPSKALYSAACRLAAADARLAHDPERPPPPRVRSCRERAARAVMPRRAGPPPAGAGLLPTWDEGIAVRFEEPAPPGRTGGDFGETERYCAAWLTDAASPPARPPLRIIPDLARLAEERVPEASPSERMVIHRALSRHAASVGEPWAKACLLEALAEAALWLPSNGNGAQAGSHLLQARTDLGLAAGYFRRMEWPERAARCEERWVRLAIPALGSGVSERTATSRELATGPATAPFPGLMPPPLLPRRPHPGRVRAVLQDAGFLTGDRRVLEDLAPLLLLAPSPLPVLILGESGTGKEVLARALHRWSRLRGEFVPIHCGAIPRDLLESELFGHTRGAFTGASADKPGLIEASDGGTLFLDEIGEMGMEAQMKMLRVLESGEVRRLGDLQSRRTAIRLVAATHRDLELEIASGRFRLDLYHRIRGVAVRLRPLRERRGDIPILAARLLSQGGPPVRLSSESLACLLAYDWPGNVRELRAVLLRAAHLARALGRSTVSPELLGLGGPGGSIWTIQGWDGETAENAAGEEAREEGVFPAGGDSSGRGIGAPEGEPLGWVVEEPLERFRAEPPVPVEGLDAYLDAIERRCILRALEQHAWNRTRAARSLGDMSRTTLLSKMKRLGIAGRENGDDPEAE